MHFNFEKISKFKKINIIVLIVFIFIIFFPLFSAGDGVDGYESARRPRFYDESKQEGRNNCIGVILFESNPGGPNVYDEYSIYYDIDGSAGEELFIIKDKKFLVSEAVAEATKQIEGENSPVYLFIVHHDCLPDTDTDYGYILVESDLPWDPNNHIDFINIYYYKTNIDCNQDTDSICSNIDLEPFYEWAAESIDDDDIPEEDDDDETPAEEDDDDNDDGQCGGCAFGPDDFSFPLVLFMILVGGVAWAVARRRTGLDIGSQKNRSSRSC